MSKDTFLKSKKSQLKRQPQRAHYDKQTIYHYLDAGFICHVGFIDRQHPVVIPTIYARQEDTLLFHGSQASRMLNVLCFDQLACVTVTHIDALVLARSAFHHSMNYRSVVLFGKGQEITDTQEKQSALEVISEHLLKGRWAQVRPPNPNELKATRVVRFAIHEATAKMRQGPPSDDKEDYALNVWAGLLPLNSHTGTPQPDPKMPSDIALPTYLSGKLLIPSPSK